MKAHLLRAIVTNGDFTASVCDSASTVGAAVWDGACGGRGIAVLDGGPRRARGRGGFGGFVPHFHMMSSDCSALQSWCL